MSTPVIQQITHVIFDFDGVLIDSERQYSAANALCLEPYGKTFTNAIKVAQMGRKKPDAVNFYLFNIFKLYNIYFKLFITTLNIFTIK